MKSFVRTAALQMALVADGGEVILQVYDDDSAVLTVRSAEREEKAAVGLTFTQASVLIDILGRIPGDGDRDDE